ncbi:hypothetical protein HDA40_000829 [Hamadaea flava]|nr:hypothetical protein [Hamadaea flava]
MRSAMRARALIRARGGGLGLQRRQKLITANLESGEMGAGHGLPRTQPSLPIKPGRAGTMTHDSKRHGTTVFATRGWPNTPADSILAKVDVAGWHFGKCQSKHDHPQTCPFPTHAPSGQG